MKFACSVALLATGATAFSVPSFATRRGTSLQMSGIMSSQTGQSSLDPAVIDRYSALAWPEDKILAEYVWVDAVGNTRSKTRTLPKAKVCVYIYLCVCVFCRDIVMMWSYSTCCCSDQYENIVNL